MLNSESKEVSNDFDLLIYAKAKIKSMHVLDTSKTEVDQYCNLPHKKQHERKRINIPDEIQAGENYKDVVISSKRTMSIKGST